MATQYKNFDEWKKEFDRRYPTPGTPRVRATASGEIGGEVPAEKTPSGASSTTGSTAQDGPPGLFIPGTRPDWGNIGGPIPPLLRWVWNKAKYDAEQMKAGEKVPKTWGVPLIDVGQLFAPKATETFKKSFGSGMGRVGTTAGNALEWIGQSTDTPMLQNAGQETQEWGKQTQQDWGKDIDFTEWQGAQSLVDPKWWTTAFARDLAFPAALAPFGLIGGAAGAAAAGAAGLGAVGTGIAAGLGSTLMSRPIEAAMEAGDAYAEAKTRQWPDDKAEAAASEVFLKNLPLGAMDYAELALALLRLPPGVRRAAAGPIAKRLGPTATKVLGTALRAGTKLGGSASLEGLEEVIQTNIQRSTLGDKEFFDPTAWTDEEAKQSFGQGFGMGLPLGAFGAVRDALEEAEPHSTSSEEAARNLAAQLGARGQLVNTSGQTPAPPQSPVIPNRSWTDVVQKVAQDNGLQLTPEQVQQAANQVANGVNSRAPSQILAAIQQVMAQPVPQQTPQPAGQPAGQPGAQPTPQPNPQPTPAPSGSAGTVFGDQVQVGTQVSIRGRAGTFEVVDTADRSALKVREAGKPDATVFSVGRGVVEPATTQASPQPAPQQATSQPAAEPNQPQGQSGAQLPDDVDGPLPEYLKENIEGNLQMGDAKGWRESAEQAIRNGVVAKLWVASMGIKDFDTQQDALLYYRSLRSVLGAEMGKPLPQEPGKSPQQGQPLPQPTTGETPATASGDQQPTVTDQTPTTHAKAQELFAEGDRVTWKDPWTKAAVTGTVTGLGFSDDGEFVWVKHDSGRISEPVRTRELTKIEPQASASTPSTAGSGQPESPSGGTTPTVRPYMAGDRVTWVEDDEVLTGTVKVFETDKNRMLVGVDQSGTNTTLYLSTVNVEKLAEEEPAALAEPEGGTKNPTPDRTRRLFRGKNGTATVYFENPTHAILFDFWGKIQKAIREGKSVDTNAWAKLLVGNLGLPEGTDIGPIANEYRESILNAVKALPKGDVKYNAPAPVLERKPAEKQPEPPSTPPSTAGDTSSTTTTTQPPAGGNATPPTTKSTPKPKEPEPIPEFGVRGEEIAEPKKGQAVIVRFRKEWGKTPEGRTFVGTVMKVYTVQGKRGWTYVNVDIETVDGKTETVPQSEKFVQFWETQLPPADDTHKMARTIWDAWQSKPENWLSHMDKVVGEFGYEGWNDFADNMLRPTSMSSFRNILAFDHQLRAKMAEAQFALEAVEPEAETEGETEEQGDQTPAPTKKSMEELVKEAGFASVQEAKDNLRAARGWPDAGEAVREYVSPRQRELTAEEKQTREISMALKLGDADAVNQAATEMAERVPDGAILVPVPSSNGNLNENLQLAERIAQKKQNKAEVMAVLRRTKPAESVMVMRKKGQPGPDVTHHQFEENPAGRVPADANIIFIDNVMTTGGTFRAAQLAMGRGKGLAFARSSDFEAQAKVEKLPAEVRDALLKELDAEEAARTKKETPTQGETQPTSDETGRTKPQEAPTGPAPNLPEDPAKVEQATFKAYVRRIGALIDTYADHIRNGSLPTGDRVQAQLRKIAADSMGRIVGEDEWSDALEAAVQKVMREKRQAGMSLLELIQAGTEMEKYLKNAARSIEKRERQQFSSPIPVAEAVHYAADARKGETVKEGSAGTGSLLETFQFDGIAVKAVELSPRRAAILTALGFDVQNADTFSRKPKADIAVGNPPFRGANKGSIDLVRPPWGKSPKDMGDLGNRFFLWDLTTAVSNGGRVVHVTSPGVVDPKNQTNVGFRNWLGENHTVRAMILFPPGAYASRGVTEATGKENTAFANATAGLLIVDKGKIENAPAPIVGQPQTWEDLVEMLKPLSGGGTHARIETTPVEHSQPIRNADSGTGSAPQGDGVGGGSSGGKTHGTKKSTSEVATGAGDGGGTAGSSDTGGRTSGGRAGSGESGNPSAGTGNGDRGSANDTGGTPPVGGQSGNASGSNGPVSEGVPGQRNEVNRGEPGDVRQGTEGEPGESAVADVPHFVEYVPEQISGRNHPGKVVEPPSLAYAERPKYSEIAPETTPHQSLIDAKGPTGAALSDVQLEVASAAHAQWLMGRGLLLADDTGLGKTGTILAVAADGQRKKLFKRTLIVTISDNVATDNFMEDNAKFGLNLDFTIMAPEANVKKLSSTQSVFYSGDSNDDYAPDPDREAALVADGNQSALEDYKKRTARWKALPDQDGIVVMSISTFANCNKAVLRWLEESSGKVQIIFDEAHVLKNVGTEEDTGGSVRAIQAKELYRRFGWDGADARGQFIYSTATAAEALDDYEFMYGLGLWNPDSWGDFKTRMLGQGDEADKKNKNAISRAIGKAKSAFQREMSLGLMEQIVRELKRLGQYFGRGQSLEGVEMVPLPVEVTGQMEAQWDNAVKFVKLVADTADTYAKKGKMGRVLLLSQVVGYMRRLRGYFMMDSVIDYINRTKAEAEAKGEKVKFIISGSFTEGDNGSPASLHAAINLINDVKVSKGWDGSKVEEPWEEAIDQKEYLRAILKGENEEWGTSPIPAIPSPVARIMEAFGDKRVGAIYGEVKPEERTAVKKMFQSDEKDIVYVTSAGSTGISLHDLTGTRIHFIHLDYDWDAKTTKQREGRANRVGQVTAPVFVYPHTKTGMDAKFVGTIMARYEAMGALSRGSTATLGGGNLSDFDFTGNIAQEAALSVLPELPEEIRVGMFGEAGRNVDPKDESTILKLLTRKDPVKRFLNMMMFLSWQDSTVAFERFVDKVGEIKTAREKSGGVSDRFETFYGKQLDVQEAKHGLKLRRIQTIQTAQQKRNIAYRKQVATEQRERAKEFYGRRKAEVLQALKETLQRANNDWQSAKADEKKLADEVARLRADASTAGTDEAWNKVRAVQGRWRAVQDRVSRHEDHVLTLQYKIEGLQNDNIPVVKEIGDMLSAVRAIEAADTLLRVAEEQEVAAKTVLLVDGNIVTTGLITDIREAVRDAAGTRTFTLELRGYQLEDGTRVVGAVVPEYAEGKVAAALEAKLKWTGTASEPAQVRAWLQAGNTLALQGGFELRWRDHLATVVVGGMNASKPEHQKLYHQFNEKGMGYVAVSRAFTLENDRVIKAFLERFPPIGDQNGGGKTGKGEEEGMAAAHPFESLGRATKPRRTSERETTVLKPVERLHVIRTIMKLLGVPIHTGRHPFWLKDTLGVFKRFSEVIRTKSAEDLLTIGHEVGHYLDKKLDLREVDGYDEELFAFIEAWEGPGVVEEKGEEYARKEGIAEFVKHWLVDPDYAFEIGPTFTKLFEDTLAVNKELYDAMTEIRKLYIEYANQSPELMAMAGISFSATQNEEPVTFEGMQNRARAGVQAFYQSMVEELTPLQVHQATLQRAMAARGWMGIADAFLEQGQVQEDGTVAGKSLKEILKPVLKDEATHMQFSTYAVARRVLYLNESRGWGDDKFPITVEAAQAAKDKWESDTFKDAFDELQEWQDSVFQFYLRSGMISEQQYKVIKKKNEVYVPFRRVELDPQMQTDRGGSGKSFVDLSQAVRVMRGGTGTVINPVESMVRNLYSMVHLAERNTVADTFFRWIDHTEGSGALAEALPAEEQITRMRVDEIVKTLRKIGMDEEEIAAAERDLDAKWTLQYLEKKREEGMDLTSKEERQYEALLEREDESDLDLSAKVLLFRSLLTPSGKGKRRGELMVWRNGKPKIYQVKDEPIYRALHMMDEETANILVKTMRPVAMFLRNMATSTAEFIARNMGRDMFSSAVYGRGLPGEALLRGLADVLAGSEAPIVAAVGQKVGGDPVWVKEWMANRGAYSSFLSVDRQHTQEKIKRTVGQLKWYQTPLNPFVLLHAWSKMVEIAPKVGEYQMARRGIDRSAWIPRTEQRGRATREQAGAESRKPTLDFNRAGTGGRMWNQVAAFFNPGVQDMDQFYRGFISPNTQLETRIRHWTRAILFLTIPTLLLARANKDDEDYERLPQWRKDLFWNVPLDVIGMEGKFAPIPIPHLLGVLFKVVPERFIVSQKKGLKQGFKGMGTTIATAATPNWIPTAFGLFAEMFWLNRNQFTGAPIVPESEKNLDPKDQYGPDTSETAKWLAETGLGEWLGISPRKVDYIARSLMGGWAGHATDILDVGAGAVRQGPAPSKRKVPIVGRIAKTLVVDAKQGSSNTMNDFYEMNNRMEQLWVALPRRADVFKTLGEYEDWTAEEKARWTKVLAKLKPEEKVLMQHAKDFRSTARKLAEMRHLIEQIEANERMTTDNKAKWIDYYRKQMESLAKKAVTHMDAAGGR